LYTPAATSCFATQTTTIIIIITTTTTTTTYSTITTTLSFQADCKATSDDKT
jgi:hypothetical protein